MKEESKVVIEVQDRQIINGITSKQKDKLEEYLTVDNPKFLQAQRFSKWGTPKTIPRYLYYFDDSEYGFEVPRGVNVEKVLGVPVEYHYNHNFCGCYYPEFKLQLRAEQEEAAKAYINSFRTAKPYNGCVIHLPTGKGKTILALYLAQKLGVKTLVLVHKNDLVVGWQKDIEHCFDGKVKPGLIKAKKREIGEQITIATVQTLGRMDDEELFSYTDKFGLVVADEVHHIGASTFNIIDVFNSVYRLGLSATPHRADGLDCCLNFFLGGLCYEYEYKEKDEDISSVEVITKNSGFRFKPILVNGKDVYNYYSFSKENLPSDFVFLEEIDYVVRPKIPNMVLDGILMSDLKYRRLVLNDIYKEWSAGHSVLALFTQKEYIDMYYVSLSEYVPEEEIIKYYGDSEESDEELLARAESREAKITFATFAKATEGTNVKAWEVLFLVSDIASAKNLEQAVGRIRRRQEGKLDPVRVYDYQSNVYSLRNHVASRMKTYEKLKCKIVGKKNRIVFNRGYN